MSLDLSPAIKLVSVHVSWKWVSVNLMVCTEEGIASQVLIQAHTGVSLGAGTGSPSRPLGAWGQRLLSNVV